MLRSQFHQLVHSLVFAWCTILCVCVHLSTFLIHCIYLRFMSNMYYCVLYVLHIHQQVKYSPVFAKLEGASPSNCFPMNPPVTKYPGNKETLGELNIAIFLIVLIFSSAHFRPSVILEQCPLISSRCYSVALLHPSKIAFL